MPQSEPKFSKGDPVWYESEGYFGDRPAKIREVHWDSYTETYKYKHRLCNRCTQPRRYVPESDYRHREE